MVSYQNENNVLKLQIYNEITSWDEMEVREALTSNDFEKIDISLNSNGGSVFAGVGIYNVIKNTNKLTTVKIDGLAASIASVIAMAGDKIIMPKNSLMMIHNASVSAFGTADELRKIADDLEKISKASCSTYLTKAKNLTAEKLQEMLDNETWLSAEECLALGLCDEVVDGIVDEVKQKAKIDFYQSLKKIKF